MNDDESLDVEFEAQEQMEIVQLIRQQHDAVRELFARVEAGEAEAVRDLLDELALHLEVEEAVLYPSLLDTELHGQIRLAAEEHLSIKRVISDLVESSPDDDRFLARVRLLRRQSEEHMDEEESEVLPALEELLDPDERVALAQEMTAFMHALVENGSEAPLEAVLTDAVVSAVR